MEAYKQFYKRKWKSIDSELSLKQRKEYLASECDSVSPKQSVKGLLNALAISKYNSHIATQATKRTLIYNRVLQDANYDICINAHALTGMEPFNYHSAKFQDGLLYLNSELVLNGNRNKLIKKCLDKIFGTVKQTFGNNRDNWLLQCEIDILNNDNTITDSIQDNNIHLGSGLYYHLDTRLFTKRLATTEIKYYGGLLFDHAGINPLINLIINSMDTVIQGITNTTIVILPEYLLRLWIQECDNNGILASTQFEEELDVFLVSDSKFKKKLPLLNQHNWRRIIIDESRLDIKSFIDIKAISKFYKSSSGMPATIDNLFTLISQGTFTNNDRLFWELYYTKITKRNQGIPLIEREQQITFQRVNRDTVFKYISEYDEEKENYSDNQAIINRLINFGSFTCDTIRAILETSDLYCNICMENQNHYNVLKTCGHAFCFQCFSNILHSCPMCRKPFKSQDIWGHDVSDFLKIIKDNKNKKILIVCSWNNVSNLLKDKVSIISHRQFKYGISINPDIIIFLGGARHCNRYILRHINNEKCQVIVIANYY